MNSFNRSAQRAARRRSVVRRFLATLLLSAGKAVAQTPSPLGLGLNDQPGQSMRGLQANLCPSHSF